ncbi:MAG: fumarylacetoacetate hydrolase family protein [Mariniblastus sp.]|nr:fumarylacetoacetate hydrolase family protein [Mariniblastus sp.]
MKIASVSLRGESRLAVERDQQWAVLEPEAGRPVQGISDWLEQVAPVSEPELIAVLEQGRWETVALSELDLLPPVARPGKVICIGKNYEDHAREMESEPPGLPIVFSKFASAIVGPGQPIVLPEISQSVDFEAELVVVIGRSGRHIRQENALDHVLGYTAGNDISARDWQKGRPGGQWLLGKTFDTFAPLGPWLVTPDELGNPHDLEIVCELNGQRMQHARTGQLIFPVDYLVAHLSKFFSLQAGDLIFTGTPAGVGAGRTPPVFLKPGDQLTVQIEKIGTLSNPVV